MNLPEGASEYGLANIANTARIDLGNASQFTEAARTIGSWVAAQGALVAYCLIIWFYARYMNNLDKEYGVAEGESE